MTDLQPAIQPPAEILAADISTLFDNADWQPFQGDFQKVRSFLPNRIYHNKAKRYGALVVSRALGGDFALSQRALQFVASAVKGGKIVDAFIVLKERDGNEIVAHRPLKEVEGTIVGVRPNDGIHGYYWWLDASFQIASKDAPRTSAGGGDWM